MLAHRLVRILWPSIHFGSEVIDFFNRISREQLITEALQIKPLASCALQQAIIQVEAVYVDVSVQRAIPKRATAGFRPPCARQPKLPGEL